MQEVQRSKKSSVVVTLELPTFPHAVLYNQTVVGPSHTGAVEDPSSPSASLLPLYDPEVGALPHLYMLLSPVKGFRAFWKMSQSRNHPVMPCKCQSPTPS